MTDFTDAKGLMAFWSDIDAAYVTRYQQWHNCEHVPERVSLPGFLRGRRYRADDDSAHFLMMYETGSTGALASNAYLAALNAPTEWTREALTHFRNPVRNIYRPVATAGSAGPFCAPWLIAVRFNREDVPDEGPATHWLSAVASAPGIERAQLWVVEEKISGIQTSERKIYGGGPGEQQFLLLIEAGAPHPAGSEALARADADVPAMAIRQDERPGRYWLEIFHETPSVRSGRPLS